MLLRVRTMVLVGVIMLTWCVAVTSAKSAASAEPEVVSVKIDAKDVACKRFMGFGAEWDSPSYARAGVTAADFAVIRKRVEWMRLPVARIMMISSWCYRGEGVYDWDTVPMRLLYRHLRVCQEMGTVVFLTDWGLTLGSTPEVKDVADPKYAEIIGTYLDYLVNVKHYDCIKYFIMVNEPNGKLEWNVWKTGVENIASVLRERGLDKKITFTGPDQVYNDEWHFKAVDQLQDILGAYDAHRYEREPAVRAGQLYDYYYRLWQYALDKDPNAKDKPLVVAEAGACRPVDSGTNRCHLDYDYGVLMADYAVQAANAGSWAVLAWMLDDNSHRNFTWGMWGDKAHGLELKPWFYTWSLLCRYFPGGSQILKTGKLAGSIRVLAAKHGVGGKRRKSRWSVCVVNSGNEPANVRLHVADGPAIAMRRYVYSKESAKADDDGFPLPVDTSTYDLGAGAVIRCEANSVVIVTSMK